MLFHLSKPSCIFVATRVTNLCTWIIDTCPTSFRDKTITTENTKQVSRVWAWEAQNQNIKLTWPASIRRRTSSVWPAPLHEVRKKLSSPLPVLSPLPPLWVICCLLCYCAADADHRVCSYNIDIIAMYIFIASCAFSKTTSVLNTFSLPSQSFSESWTKRKKHRKAVKHALTRCNMLNLLR